MPLRLVLGPANARKVGTLLDAHEVASRAGRLAWFVVPSSADVGPFQRELAGLTAAPGQDRRRPTPFGQVMVGGTLEQQLLTRLGAGERLLSQDHRRAVALAAIRGTSLAALAPAARSGWLAQELIALAEELATTGDLGAGAEKALEAWSARSSDARGDELAALLRADARLLRLLSVDGTDPRVDRAGAASIVRAALRAAPSALADLHLVLSGFDDLDPVQRTLVLAIARSEAEVVVSLPYREGREALAAARGLVDFLQAAAPQVEELDAEPGPATGAALLRVERRLYEQVVFQANAMPADPFEGVPRDALGRTALGTDPGSALGPLVPEYQEQAGSPEAGSASWDQADTTSPIASGTDLELGAEPVAGPGQAPLVELRGGGPDEEAALIAEHVAEAIRDGRAPERIAIAVADPVRQGPALCAALRRADVPAHLVGSIKAATSPSVAALVALLRAVADDGQARHVVDWIAGPGGPGGADALDATVRRRGAGSAREALGVWAYQGGEHLQEFEELWAARRRDAAPGSLEAAAAAALRTRMGVAMRARGARAADAERDLRAAARVLALLDELATLAARLPELGLGLGLGELRELIESVPAAVDDEPAGSIAVVGPLGIRTRYLEVVVLARAQRGTYPAAEPVRRVLTSGDRAALREFGWPAPARPDHAASERYLAYEVVARPTAQLVLAWHDGDGDGKPCEPSPLLAEVRRAARDDADAEVIQLRTMPSGSAARHAMGAQRRTRVQDARGGPRHREPTPDQSALLAAQDRDRHAVGALQTASRCAAQWFADHHLRPRPLSPDAAPLTAGRLRHEVLADVVRTVVTGGESLRPEALGALQSALAEAAERLARRGSERRETLAERLMRERVVAEIDATLPALCGHDVLGHQPAEFELAFGTLPRGAEPDGDAPVAGTTATDAETDDLRPPIVVERAGERLVLAGRIDRLDLSPDHREIVVVDYKGANVDQYRGQGWIEARELQAGLYALAAEQLLGQGSRAIASLYQPVPGPLGQAARGAAVDELPGRTPLSRTDRLGEEDWDALLDALVGLAGDAQRLIDDGVVRPDPSRCSSGGCRYPWLCREVQA